MGERRKKRRAVNAQSRRKRKARRRGFNIVSLIILIIAVCVFFFALYKLVITLMPYAVGKLEYSKIKDIALEADENGEGYSVDFDALLDENADTVAWIRFEEPSIVSYPVVHSHDNSDYLTKTFSENDNKLGAIFLDKDSSDDFTDRVSFIFGHNLSLGGEMFSQLTEYQDQEFYEEYPEYYLYTPDGKVRTYTIFSADVVPYTTELYRLTFDSDEDFLEYIDAVKAAGLYDTGVEVDADDHVLALSTCTNNHNDDRLVLFGVETAID